jgi:hypothetical protein
MAYLVFIATGDSVTPILATRFNGKPGLATGDSLAPILVTETMEELVYSHRRVSVTPILVVRDYDRTGQN